jgi:hypothetical protein
VSMTHNDNHYIYLGTSIIMSQSSNLRLVSIHTKALDTLFNAQWTSQPLPAGIHEISFSSGIYDNTSTRCNAGITLITKAPWFGALHQ